MTIEEQHAYREALIDRLQRVCVDASVYRVGDLDFERDAWCIYRAEEAPEDERHGVVSRVESLSPFSQRLRPWGRPVAV